MQFNDDFPDTVKMLRAEIGKLGTFNITENGSRW